MSRTDHIYQDPSHFRTPLRDLRALVGFGVDTGIPPAIDAATEIDSSGIRHYRESVAPQVAGMLYGYLAKSPDELTTNVTGLDTVLVKPFTPEEIASASAGDELSKQIMANFNALKWAQERAAAGMAVFVPFSVLWPTTDTANNGVLLGAMLASDRASMAAASAMPIGAFLMDPWSNTHRDWLLPFGIALVVAAGVGLGAVAYKKWVKRGHTLRGPLSGQ
jgi:hypothetical protein